MGKAKAWCGCVVTICGLAALCVGAAGQVRKGAPAGGAAEKREAEPTGPTVVIDTGMGRMTCRLYTTEAPVTSASFVDAAEGKKDWTDPVTGTVQHGVPFYDGTTFVGVTDGVKGGGISWRF